MSRMPDGPPVIDTYLFSTAGNATANGQLVAQLAGSIRDRIAEPRLEVPDFAYLPGTDDVEHARHQRMKTIVKRLYQCAAGFFGCRNHSFCFRRVHREWLLAEYVLAGS